MFAFLKDGVGARQREEVSPHLALNDEVAFQNFNRVLFHFPTLTLAEK